MEQPCGTIVLVIPKGPSTHVTRTLGFYTGVDHWLGPSTPSFGVWNKIVNLVLQVRHPLAQRPHIVGLLGLLDLNQQSFGTLALRPHLGGTLGVEGKAHKDI